MLHEERRKGLTRDGKRKKGLGGHCSNDELKGALALQLEKGDHQQEKGEAMPIVMIFKVGAHRGGEELVATVQTMADLALSSLVLPYDGVREREREEEREWGQMTKEDEACMVTHSRGLYSYGEGRGRRQGRGQLGILRGPATGE